MASDFKLFKKKDDKKAPESTNISRPADTSKKEEVTEEKEPQQPA